MPKPKPAAAPDDLIVSVALSDLIISPMNPRALAPEPGDIEFLAASIEACGLMQNLSGYADAEPPGKVEIVDGKRRLLALQHLARLTGTDPYVPVAVTHDRAQALAWAGAGNTQRRALHPVDEIRAYAQMSTSGADANAIARAFGVTERHVKQRLKLADLPAAVLEALKNGKLSLDQAQAFTVARSEDDAAAILHEVLNGRWTIGATEIRSKLTGQRIRSSDRRVVFVTLPAYEAMGGQLTRDLFSDSAWIEDEPLLQRLFDAKLAAAAAEAAAEGWASVQVMESGQPDYNLSHGMTILQRVPGELSDADFAEYNDIAARAEQDVLSEADAARLAELEWRADGDYTDDDRAVGVLWLYVDFRGDLQRHGPYRPAPQDEGAEDDTIEVTREKAISASMIADMHMIRIAALQQELSLSPDLALDLLAWQIETAARPWEAPLAVTPSFQPIAVEKAEGYDLPPGLIALDKREEKPVTALSFKAFRDQVRREGPRRRNHILAVALARSLKTSDLAPWLADLLQPNPRTWWTPTKSAYFARLPQSHLDAIWRQLAPEDSHVGFLSNPKADKVALLHKLFNDADYREALGTTRDQNTAIDEWLPPEMLWPDLGDQQDEEAA